MSDLLTLLKLGADVKLTKEQAQYLADLIEQQQARIDELAAMIERLRGALVGYAELEKIEGDGANVATSALESTPHQNLNAVKREVAKAAVKTALINLGEGSLSEQDISSFAKLYANTNYPSDKE